ncbi:ArsR/SmtB family transcription factor [Lentibacillus songyuanensis]|uniref:ArsR/SmtB family transcription factor n=1 Tax=Lentibacillus songyuanensis TaxID=3136161 RepID=UPI0031BA19D1
MQALGDPVRQDIIIILAENEQLNVSEVTSLTKVSRPAVSHHLRILKEASIVKMDKKGKNNVYFLDANDSLQGLKRLIEKVEELCDK